MEIRRGGCNCGAVRLEIHGAPHRTGICHCLACRRETGSPFMWFGVWNRAQVKVTGTTKSWIATTEHRHFCPICGTPLFATHDNDTEIEIRLGALDCAPSDLPPDYELFVGRREHWLHALEGTPQHGGNRA